MGIFKKKTEDKISVYDRAFFDKLFETLGVSHAENILEVTNDAKYINEDIFSKYAPFVDKVTNINDIDGGIFDKVFIINIDNDIENTLSIAKTHTDGNVFFVFTNKISDTTKDAFLSLKPENSIISDYSVFIF